jgi:hypothetical protein
MKDIGKKIKKQDKELCIGILMKTTFLRNFMETGEIINKMVLELIFGLKIKEKENI